MTNKRIMLPILITTGIITAILVIVFAIASTRNTTAGDLVDQRTELRLEKQKLLNQLSGLDNEIGTLTLRIEVLQLSGLDYFTQLSGTAQKTAEEIIPQGITLTGK